MILPIERDKLPVAVVRQVKAVIASGQFRPGDKLPTEREWSIQLKVSRASVREAMRTLEALGLVEVRPGRGTFVRHGAQEGSGDEASSESLLFRGDIHDLVEVRAMIETKSCALAAKRASPDDLDAMQAAIDNMRDACSAADLAEMVIADVTFHEAVAKAAKNELVSRLLTALERELIDCRRVVLSLPGAPDRSVARHQLILDAIKSKDGDWAAGLMLDHLKALEVHVCALEPGKVRT